MRRVTIKKWPWSVKAQIALALSKHINQAPLNRWRSRQRQTWDIGRDRKAKSRWLGSTKSTSTAAQMPSSSPLPLPFHPESHGLSVVCLCMSKHGFIYASARLENQLNTFGNTWWKVDERRWILCDIFKKEEGNCTNAPRCSVESKEQTKS